MRQKVEIEVDVPEGWETTGEFRRVLKGDRYLAASGKFIWTSDVPSSEKYIILEKVEPKRESRWKNLYEVEEEGYGSREGADKASHIESRQGCIRLDYEDGKLVAVTLEPEGEVRDE